MDRPAESSGGQRLLRWLERLVLAAETVVNKLAGDLRLNPFYHTDTIAFFFLIVVAISGLYLVFFYQFGFQASYESVAKMDRFPLSWVMRAVHRYASVALMLFTLLHALRIFFQDRFRGARRSAWLWGIATTATLWLAGISGYLLLWDQRAQLMVQALENLLQPIPTLAAALYGGLMADAAEEMSWLAMLLFLGLHVGISALGGLFYWYHIQRLRRPRFFPATHWMIGIAVILLALALIFPASLLPMADFSRLPEAIPLDVVYLSYLPFGLQASNAGLWLYLVILGVLAAIMAALPWIMRRREPPRLVVTPDLCTGCTLCAKDCPYGALAMQPREDGSRYKQIAVVEQTRCVACGICIGSCNTLALSLGERPARLLWQDVASRLKLAQAEEGPVRVVFACERHVAQGARTYLRTSPEDPPPSVGGMHVEVIPVTCAAMAHPGLLARCLDAGATEVQVVGCPPDDCTNREGNLWLQERLNHKRAPSLRRKYVNAPIFATWVAPDQFEQALQNSTEPHSRLWPGPAGLDSDEDPRAEGPEAEAETADEHTGWQRLFSTPNWRSLVVGLAVVGLFLILAVGLAGIPYSPPAGDGAYLLVTVRYDGKSSPEQVTLDVDGQRLLKDGGRNTVFERVPLPPGEHQVHLAVQNGGQLASQVLFDQTVNLDRGQVLELAFDTGR